MHFAARTAFEPAASQYAAALHRARLRGNLLDLTVSNPTRCGFDFSRSLLEPLQNDRGLHYDPHPLGLSSARLAVANMYRDEHAAAISPGKILLTASTSEAYSYLLRLLCDPGDAVLVPSPSYPLFDLLARLHDVDLIPYPLRYHDGWQIDAQALNACVTPRTRAIVAIHPNNPTGHYCSPTDRDALLRCAQQHGLPLIVDEVFLEYPVEGQRGLSFLSDPWPSYGPLSDPVLTVVLGGVSKLLCMPQMKLAWTALTGPPELVNDVIARLEVIADTFLSVSTPPQVALPLWLANRDSVAGQVRQRLLVNLAALDESLRGTAVSRFRVDAGWAAVLRIPANEVDEVWAARLLDEQGVAVHPGSFYGFTPRGWLVVSLLPPEEEFRRGVRALVQAV